MSDLEHLYRQAASAQTDDANASVQAPHDESLEGLRFRLESCVMGARMKLQDSGFHSAHKMSADDPLVHLHVGREGQSSIFTLFLPRSMNAEGQSSYSSSILLKKSDDPSLWQFDLRDEQGQIGFDCFERVSGQIARHVAIECAKQARMAPSGISDPF